MRMDPMCAFCYKRDSPEKLKLCGKCFLRRYCSPECQKLDWGKSGQWHQSFCALGCGEEGDSWEVRFISDAVGFGVFATKPFAAGQRIMVERAIPTALLWSEARAQLASSAAAGNDAATASRAESLHEAVMDLAPRTDSLMRKLNTNAISLGPSGPSTPGGICVRMSRVNHRCDNNADHYFIRHTGRTNGVCALFATQAIRVDEQIFISYVDRISPGHTIQEHAARLLVQYGITCGPECACKSDVYKQNVRRANELDASIIALGSQGQGRQQRQALKAAKELLALYDEMGGVSANAYKRTYYDAFQVAVMSRCTIAEASGFIKSARAMDLLMAGYDTEDGLRYRDLLADPSCHRNYMMGI